MNRNLFPGMLPHARTYAAWPVWADSCRAEVRFKPMPKRQAVRLWHDARRFERQTRQPGRQDGAIGRNGLAILQVLLFDFMNYRSGALYPSWAAIAAQAGISERSVGRGLARLKNAGVAAMIAAARGTEKLHIEESAMAALPAVEVRKFRTCGAT
jgi:hypothetical protein